MTEHAEQYVETPDGLNIRNFWTKEGDEGMKAAIEAIARFDNPTAAVKDIIDNPDLNQHQSEVAVSYVTGIRLGMELSRPKDPITEFLESLDG